MTLDLERLKGLAEAASGGQWVDVRGRAYTRVITRTADAPDTMICSATRSYQFGPGYDARQYQAESNAAFIAAANPQTILHLIQLLTDREAEIARLLPPEISEIRQSLTAEPKPSEERG